MINIGFDIYTMAREAMKSGQYHGGIVFYEILAKQCLKEGKGEIGRYSYFEELTITCKHLQLLLTKSKKEHDDILLEKGHVGKHFQCNSVPFNKKMKQLMRKRLNSNLTILDRDTLFSFMTTEREKRHELGRRRWAEEKSFESSNTGKEFLASNRIQVNRLCNGVQLRVGFFKTILALFFSYNVPTFIHLFFIAAILFLFL